MTFRKTHFWTLGVSVAAGAAILSGFALAQSGGQPAKPASNKPEYGTFNFTTEIGSFKLLDGQGKVEFSFTGTVLVSQLKGTVSPSPSLKLEYSGEDKKVWHGTGSIVIEGEFRAVQWFGTKMNGKWHGYGRARVYGEFDKNLNTGWYWYGDDPSRKIAWSMYGMEVGVPEFQQGGTGKPVERGSGGG